MADRQAAALADREADDAVVAADDGAREIDDLARLVRLGAQLAHDAGIVAVRHEADVLAVGLVGHGEVEAFGQRAGLTLRHVAEREAQEVELLGGRAEQEITLVARRVAAAMEFGTGLAQDAADVMAGGQRLGAELARGAQEVAKLHRAIAGDARHGRLAAQVGVGEGVHHLVAEAAFVIEHVMRDAETVGHLAGIADVLAGATGALLADRDAMIVELQCDAHDLVALLLEQRGRDR